MAGKKGFVFETSQYVKSDETGCTLSLREQLTAYRLMQDRDVSCKQGVCGFQYDKE
jgi:hypothetical protein